MVDPPATDVGSENGNANTPLEQQLVQHNVWREDMLSQIGVYEAWLRRHDQLNDDVRQTLLETTHSLEKNNITIALVGEYSRGKTELINAIFFADYKRRLLPSTPGRTTMCTTEILYVEKEAPSLRLLPIETRQSNKLMSELGKDRSLWHEIPLNVDSVNEMAAALQALSQTRWVPQAEARDLGFRINQETVNDADGTVKIPQWRHAVVNYPHPLLKQGLVILDTPGLNALGSEPELTLCMLPNAHAVIFVLAADTGVTHTDLQIWKNHVHVPTRGDKRGRLATLNKIDTLWDELLTPEQIEDNIQRQISDTARLLDVPRENVIAVSAAKGLVAKVKGNDELLTRTGLATLEKKLSFDIIAAKHDIQRERIVDLIGTLVSSNRNILNSRLQQRREELAELKSMHGKGHDVLQASIARLMEQKRVFEIEVESFRATRRMLTQQSKVLSDMLSLQKFDSMCNDAQVSMQKSLTTSGIKNRMATLFAELTETLNRVEDQSEKVRGLITHSYNKFHLEHGLPKMLPMKFSMNRYTGKLAELIAEAMTYKDSPRVVVRTQNSIIKHMFEEVAIRIRTLLEECDSAAQHWAQSVLNPIHDQLHEHRYIITQRLENLTALRDSQLDLTGRLKTLGDECVTLEADLKEIQVIVDNIVGDQCLSPSVITAKPARAINTRQSAPAPTVQAGGFK